MAHQCRNMYELIYVINGVWQSAYVGWYVDCKKTHSTNDIKIMNAIHMSTNECKSNMNSVLDFHSFFLQDSLRMASQCWNMLEFDTCNKFYFISWSARVSCCTECKNMHGMSNIKFLRMQVSTLHPWLELEAHTFCRKILLHKRKISKTNINRMHSLQQNHSQNL
jgi:hypothetical protein